MKGRELLIRLFGLIDFATTMRYGDETGIAIVECIAFGPYRPYGLGEYPSG